MNKRFYVSQEIGGVRFYLGSMGQWFNNPAHALKFEEWKARFYVENDGAREMIEVSE